MSPGTDVYVGSRVGTFPADSLLSIGQAITRVTKPSVYLSLEYGYNHHKLHISIGTWKQISIHVPGAWVGELRRMMPSS